MNIKVRFIALVLSITLTGGCGITKSKQSDSPTIDVPIKELNYRISLSAPQAINTFKLGNEVVLEVEIVSEDKIAFKHDYGARIFLRDDNGWREIRNYVEYNQGYIILESRKLDPFNVGSAIIYPYLPDQTEGVKLRIFIIGNIYKDGVITPEKTAAYIDVALKP